MIKLNKKGFTLVELLAVIVVLAIIALIGFTSVGPIIENSRKESAKDNILQYIHALETGCAAYQAFNDGISGTSINTVNALTQAKFTGTQPTPNSSTTISFDASCNVLITATTGNKPTLTSNGRTCVYSSSEWNCS